MLKFKILLFILILTFVAISESQATVLDFNSLHHGEIVSTQYLLSHGVSISAVNRGGGPNLAIIFNSTRTGTADPDLEDPWDRGNLAPNTYLGNMLIIAENNRDSNNDGFIDSPDDEGSRPAGSLFFDFARPVNSFGFDVVDIEGTEEWGSDNGYFAAFYSNGSEVGRIRFADLVGVNGIVFGDNSANTLPDIFASQFNVGYFDRVEINLGGSGAIDNIRWSNVPEPSTMLLFGIGGLAVALVKKKRYTRK